jgi:hypothetical protein
MKLLLLTLAFALELVAFAAFSAFPFVFEISALLRIGLFIILFVLLITFWGVYMAPRASKKLNVLPYYCAKLIIYAVSAFVLFELIGTGVGLVFIVACLLDEAFLYKHNTAK